MSDVVSSSGTCGESQVVKASRLIRKKEKILAKLKKEPANPTFNAELEAVNGQLACLHCPKKPGLTSDFRFQGPIPV